MCVILLVLYGCDDRNPKICLIEQFEWSGFEYKLVYTGNRLDQLITTDSHIDLTYDENDLLHSAEFYLPGDVSPSLEQFFSHGPDGIDQIDEFRGMEHSRYLITYSSNGSVYQITEQEFDPGTSTVTFEITGTYKFDADNNLAGEYRSSAFIWSDYRISDYDQATNPFIVLAEAVNHPQFFPLGRFVRFPIGNFDVSVANRLSENNPLYAEYELPGFPPAFQEFSYTYDGIRPTSLQWDNDDSGFVTTRFYKFLYSCQ